MTSSDYGVYFSHVAVIILRLEVRTNTFVDQKGSERARLESEKLKACKNKACKNKLSS